MDKIVTARKEPCTFHKPLELSYNGWHTEAEKRHKSGKKQRQCPDCLYWYWKDEFGIK